MLEISGEISAVLGGTYGVSASRFGRLDWLPELISPSVLKDVFKVRLRSLARWARGQVSQNESEQRTPMLAPGDVKNRAELARRKGVSRARATQVLASTAGN